MNQLLGWLKAGNLASDGDADEVVRFVCGDLRLLDDLIEGLAVDDGAVRGHTADAVEKIARAHPEPVVRYLPALVRSAREDPVAMVRWHVAMTLGHLSIFPEAVDEMTDVLIELLADRSAFTQSWAIASLCIIGRGYPHQADRIVRAISPLGNSGSAAVRSRASKALPILTDHVVDFPKGWIKSEHVQAQLDR